MLNTRTRVGRAAAVSFALVGAFGLSACQDAGPTTSAPPTSAAPTAQSTSAPEETSTPEETQPPETSESPSSSEAPSSSETSSGGDAGDTTLTPEGTTLKFGQSANVRESTTSQTADGYRVQVDSLEKAPDSVYGGQITKSNGPVYFLRYTLTNTGQSNGSSFDADSVNSFMLTPKIQSGQTGKKIIGSPAGCESDANPLAVGESGKGCDAYQVSGSEVSEVVWSPGLRTVVTWTK